MLHHAAVFFQSRDPGLAEALLERAIRLEPEAPFHVEGLGILYGWHSCHETINASFATHARTKLLASTDGLILGAALNAIQSSTKGLGGDLGMVLWCRVRELTGEAPPTLPSLSERYHRSQCQRPDNVLYHM